MAEEVELKLALAEGHQARFLRHPLLKQASIAMPTRSTTFITTPPAFPCVVAASPCACVARVATGCKPSNWPAVHPPG
jgi:hypothetical protein